MNGAYYNEHDPFAASWLRALIAGGHIAPGDVDERDIQLVQPDDLRGYAQHHFFAGIGGWSLALRLAGWPDDRPVWTGSCPCQPFSSAGKGEGFNDPRHLWPTWFRLIRECKPPVVFGEQVASADGLAWFDSVSTDLEAEGFAVGAADLCAAGVGAPHIRQRLWYVAESEGARLPLSGRRGGASTGLAGPKRSGEHGGLADPDARGQRVPRTATAARRATGEPHADERGPDGALADPDGGLSRDGNVQRGGEHGQQPQDGGAGERLEHASSWGRQEPPERDGEPEPHPADRDSSGPDAHGSNPWARLVWLPCRDGKTRPTQPGLFPLAHGVPNRVGTLRGAGNAIVPYLAAEFIRAYGEAVGA